LAGHLSWNATIQDWTQFLSVQRHRLNRQSSKYLISSGWDYAIKNEAKSLWILTKYYSTPRIKTARRHFTGWSDFSNYWYSRLANEENRVRSRADRTKSESAWRPAFRAAQSNLLGIYRRSGFPIETARGSLLGPDEIWRKTLHAWSSRLGYNDKLNTPWNKYFLGVVQGLIAREKAKVKSRSVKPKVKAWSASLKIARTRMFVEEQRLSFDWSLRITYSQSYLALQERKKAFYVYKESEI
jgi:hypothetical protein